MVSQEISFAKTTKICSCLAGGSHQKTKKHHRNGLRAAWRKVEESGRKVEMGESDILNEYFTVFGRPISQSI